MNNLERVILDILSVCVLLERELTKKKGVNQKFKRLS